MWVRKRLDISWGDLLFGLGAVLCPLDRLAWQRRVEAAFSPDGDALACLSVRSGFDLLWSALALPPSSEVLITAITIPDMVRILKHHALVPVPIDIDAAALAPDLDDVRRAITPATRAIVVAHLLGGRVPLDGLIELAREHGLLLVEDCAQAFDGSSWRGHPAADVSMFSFGTIKTATALGGGLLRVSDPALRARMEAVRTAQVVQSRGAYLRRLLKYAGLKAICLRWPFAALLRVLALCGCDYDRVLNGLVRGFAGPDFFTRIRRQPSAPLLALLARRLRRFDPLRLADRAAKGRRLRDRLAALAACPGQRLLAHSFWVFAILARDPARLIAALHGSGFDATQGQSLCVVSPPADRPDAHAPAAQQVLEGMVYLPFYPDLPAAELERMADVVLSQAAALARIDARASAARDCPERAQHLETVPLAAPVRCQSPVAG